MSATLTEHPRKLASVATGCARRASRGHSVRWMARDRGSPTFPQESLTLHFGFGGCALMQRKPPSVPEFAVLKQLALPAVRLALKP